MVQCGAFLNIGYVMKTIDVKTVLLVSGTNEIDREVSTKWNTPETFAELVSWLGGEEKVFNMVMAKAIIDYRASVKTVLKRSGDDYVADSKVPATIDKDFVPKAGVALPADPVAKAAKRIEKSDLTPEETEALIAKLRASIASE